MDLIVFDLDGTLLNSTAQISPFTRDTLSLMTDKGIPYTLATGRTLHSAQNIVAGHGFNLPHIYSNGVLIWDPQAQTLSLDNILTTAEAKHVINAVLAERATPFISCVDANNEHFIFHPPLQHEYEKRLESDYLNRQNATVLTIDAMPEGILVTNISLLAYSEQINRIRKVIESEPHLIAYSGPAFEGQGLNWMDIHHRDANKGGAVNTVCEQLGVKNLICFGDNDNDLSMFAIANESYATANASAIVKAAATGTVGAHHEDGVAHYLRERFSL